MVPKEVIRKLTAGLIDFSQEMAVTAALASPWSEALFEKPQVTTCARVTDIQSEQDPVDDFGYETVTLDNGQEIMGVPHHLNLSLGNRVTTVVTRPNERLRKILRLDPNQEIEMRALLSPWGEPPPRLTIGPLKDMFSANFTRRKK